LTSYSENFGNVVLEALASSCPVLLTPEVGLAPAVATAGVGEVVDGNAVAIAAGLDRLQADNAVTAAMRPRARAFAVEYSWPAMAARMERLYGSLSR
jgi:glycosyltransferase involved in cell wall biosynthesis